MAFDMSIGISNMLNLYRVWNQCDSILDCNLLDLFVFGDKNRKFNETSALSDTMNMSAHFLLKFFLSFSVLLKRAQTCPNERIQMKLMKYVLDTHIQCRIRSNRVAIILFIIKQYRLGIIRLLPFKTLSIKMKKSSMKRLQLVCSFDAT